MSFLKAGWRKLILANYEIAPSLLQKYIPHQTELDFWKNTCYVSLVGFMFTNVRLLGIPIPFHTNFEEVNLRFYVRYKDILTGKWKRGVVFIKELVPKHALSFVANTVYKEHYETVPMKHLWLENNEEAQEQKLTVRYDWEYQKHPQSMEVKAINSLTDIVTGSEAEFITEHYWGYTRINDKTTYEYEVTHPKWQQYPVLDYNINVDFGKVYGSPFKELSQAVPKSVFLAEGSAITVENKRRI